MVRSIYGGMVWCGCEACRVCFVVCRVWCVVCGTLNVMCGVHFFGMCLWYVLGGSCCVVWCVACGVWCVAYGVWRAVGGMQSVWGVLCGALCAVVWYVCVL